MNKKKSRAWLARCACLIAMSIAAAPSLAAPATDWKPELVIPSNGIFGPSETLRITLPKLPDEVLQRLSLELDDMDVTGLVAREGDQAVFTPPQPLVWGQHQLRLVEHTPDGGILERGAWTLEVRKTTHFREAQLNSNVTLNVTRRVSEASLVNPPDRTQSNGAAQLQGTLANDGWRVDGNADVLYNSQVNQLPRNKQQADLGTFLLTGNAGPVTVNAGHHAVGQDSLVMQGFNRRGVSASVASPGAGASLTGFELHTEDIIGAQQGFGIGDPGNRVSGVVATARPVASDRDALLVTDTYVSGEGPDQLGVSAGGDPAVTGGRANSLVADGSLLDKRLRLRGEYAASGFDFDGLQTGFGPQSDHAYAALAQFTPWHDKTLKGQPMAVNVGLEDRRIGTFFRSPANPGGIADREALRGFAGFDWYGLNAQFSLGHETDNVDDLVQLPRTKTTQGGLSLTYTPLQKFSPDGQPLPSPWYGQPSYNMTYVKMDQAVTKATPSLPDGPLHATRNLTLSASFNYSTWNWSISHSIGKDDDLKNFTPDTDNRLTQLAANLLIGSKLSLGPSLQLNKVTNKDDHRLDSATTTAGLNIGYVFTQKLSSNLSYNFNHQDVKDGSSDVKSHDLAGNLSWLVQQAHGMKPGVILSLEGQYHDMEDHVVASNNQSNYQVFLKGSVSWQPGY